MFDIVPPRLEEPGREQTPLPVPPRPKRSTQPTTPQTPLFLAPKPLRRASSHDYLCEKARYFKSKSDGAEACPSLPPSNSAYYPPLSPVGKPKSSRRTSVCSSLTIQSAPPSIPPVPPIPAEFIRPTDKRPILRPQSHIPSESAKSCSVSSRRVYRASRRMSQSRLATSH